MLTDNELLTVESEETSHKSFCQNILQIVFELKKKIQEIIVSLPVVYRGI